MLWQWLLKLLGKVSAQAQAQLGQKLVHLRLDFRFQIKVAGMANIAQQRIQREFREVVKSKEIAESGVQLELVADDLTELAGTVAGPPDTPYSGGKFKLEIKIPDTYPFNPPKVLDDLVWYCPII